MAYSMIESGLIKNKLKKWSKWRIRFGSEFYKKEISKGRELSRPDEILKIKFYNIEMVGSSV